MSEIKVILKVFHGKDIPAPPCDNFERAYLDASGVSGVKNEYLLCKNCNAWHLFPVGR